MLNLNGVDGHSVLSMQMNVRRRSNEECRAFYLGVRTLNLVLMTMCELMSRIAIPT